MRRPAIIVAWLIGLALPGWLAGARTYAEDLGEILKSAKSDGLLDSWRELASRLAGEMLLDSEQGVLFYTFDTLAYPGQTVDLTARVQSTRDLKGVGEIKVGFFLGDKLLAQALTNNSGYAWASWTPPKRGDYAIEARILALGRGVPEQVLNVKPAPLLVAAREKEDKFVVVDLDYTLVESSFSRVLAGDAKPMPRSPEVMTRIAKAYSVIYLTHRPDIMTRRSKNWLADHGYPPAPVLVSELQQAFGDSGQYKTARLGRILESFPNIMIGIGDKPSDALAYVTYGLTAYLIPKYKPDKPKELRKTADTLRQLPDRGGKLQVVSGWEQIEAGIFEGQRFAPEVLARSLEARARRLEAQKASRQPPRRSRRQDD